MPTTLPTPVAAALGIVPAVLDNARKLPGKAVHIPVLAVSGALTALETWRREYDGLAQRGERLVGRLRGSSVDEFQDRIQDLVAKTPFAGAYDAVEDTVEDAVKVVTGAGKAAKQVEHVGHAVGERVSEAAEDTVAKVSELLDRAATRTPSIKATSVPAVPTRAKPAPITTAATQDVAEVVEAVTAAVAASPEAAPVTSHDELPLADYDHLTLGALRGQLRALSVEDLVRVRDYEKAHAHRLPVVTLLDNRIAKLATEAAAGPETLGTQTPAAPAIKVPAKKIPAKKKTAKKTTAKKARTPKVTPTD